MQKLLAQWWFRIILIIVALIIFTIPQLLFPFGTLLNSLLFIILLTATSIFILALRAGSDYKAFGLQLDKFALSDFGKGLLIVLIMNLIFVLLGILFGYSFELNKNFADYDLNVFYFNFAYIFVMAFSEEILFRGLIFQSIRERFGDVVAIVVLSLFFSLAHFMNPNISIMGLINIIIAGVALSVLYITTESLWLPISVHFFWNLNQQLLLGSNISGINFDLGIFNLTAIGSSSSWLFGGSFGIEEGLLTAILLTLLTLISFRINKQNPYVMATKFNIKFEESRMLQK